MLKENKRVVVVNGMGGIGKTSLAAAYTFQQYKKYKYIAWISNNSENLAVDFVQNADLRRSLGLEDLAGDRGTIFYAILHELRSLEGKRKLLVIDNATHDIAPYLDILPTQPNWHVLITSRDLIAHTHTHLMELDFLAEEDAEALFKAHCSRITDDQQIKALVKAVDYHTLTIEILARTAQLQRLEFSQLIVALEQDARANVPTAHSNQAKVERILSYLSTVFTLSGLSDNELWLLKYFIGLPSEFITFENLKVLIEPEQSSKQELFSELLENLAAKGWLLRDKSHDSYKMHLVVQEVARNNVDVLIEDIEPLISNVTSLLHIDQTCDNPIEKFVFVPFGETLRKLFPSAGTEAIARLYNTLALVLQDLGDYAGAKELLEKAMASDEKNFGAEHPTTAVRYSNLATVLKDLGDYAGAKELLEKAMASAEKNFGAEHPTTAVRYSNLALVLQDLGDLRKALSMATKANRVFMDSLPASHPYIEGSRRLIETLVNAINSSDKE